MKHLKLSLSILIMIGLLAAGFLPVWGNTAGNLIIHHSESEISPEGDSHMVGVLISVLDANKNPITALGTRDVSLLENGQSVEVDEVEPYKDLPVQVVLMMDKSVSMRGTRMSIARNAVLDFIKNLYRGDSLSIYAFNTSVSEVQPIISDLNQAQELFQSAEILPGFGTCLFDAAYQAVQSARDLPEGRKAVVVLSGGPDTVTGTDVCSDRSVDEVISLANQDGEFLPVFTIGVGDDLEDTALRRLANETGGVYVQSRQDAEMVSLLKQVANRLASQYLITYTSTAGPGAHALAVQVDNYTQTTEVTLTGLPPIISIAYPGEDEPLEPGLNRFVLSVVERGVSIDSLSFLIDDIPIGVGGKLGEPPYEYEIDLSQYDGRAFTLAILALDQGGQVLSETERLIDFSPEGVDAEDEPGALPADVDAPCPEGMLCLGGLQLSVNQLLLVGGILLGLGILVAVIVMLSKKRGRKTKQEAGEEKVSLFDDATMDGFALPDLQFGRLTMLSSDDPLLVGKEFQLTKSPTTIGRSVNNDIPLPKDSAVSRKHLELLSKENGVVVREAMKTLNDGTKQPPTYGTYINDRKMTEETYLHNGDEISMGRRTKLRFESDRQPVQEDAVSEDVTFDGIQLPDDLVDDATRDG